MEETTLEITYRCPKCRKVLFSDSDIIGHDDNTTKKIPSKFKTSKSSVLCSVYNVSPKPWMREELNHQSVSGKIVCPHQLKNGVYCGSKLGEYHWEGSTCSCGMWITPAFLIPKSKVDKVTQNLHSTLSSLT